jgi:alpha-N-arabinofuranosidase
LRRRFRITESRPETPTLLIHTARIETCEVYINGIPAVSSNSVPSSTEGYVALPIEDRTALHPGDNVLALRCQRRARNYAVDAGFVDIPLAPPSWQHAKSGGECEFQIARIGRGDNESLMISSEKGGDGEWYLPVRVKPFARYRLTGWIKTENLTTKGGAHGALLNLRKRGQVRTEALTGTNDWTRVEVEFNSEGSDYFELNCLYGGWGLATGKAWFDDVRVELIEEAKLEPHLIINASKTRERVSKYIYGQFIEYLGHCIRVGLWAEMLEDRKFFYTVGDENSPWKAVGSGDVLRMSKEDAFVGEHTPVVRLDGKPKGIQQHGLSLRSGREYDVYIIVAGDASAEPIEVTLAWGNGGEDCTTQILRGIGSEYRKIRLAERLCPKADTDDGVFSICSRGTGELRIGTASLMPADNVHGVRRDVLALLKELGGTIYRWPGGNFVSGYDWKDGIGDRDRRPPRKNPAWRWIEMNDFGLHEFMWLCSEIGTEPLIVVNSGQGDVKMAVEELQYFNGAPDTPMGRLRAANGHSAPYNVTWWGIGNEMFGSWQLGYMPLDEYVKKHNIFADAMRKEDPGIKLIGVGDMEYWTRRMLENCADHMELISEHFYCRERPSLPAHVMLAPGEVRRKAEGLRKLRREIPGLTEKDIRIALDEWNYMYHSPAVYGEIGEVRYMKDALGIAAGLNEIIRNSDIFFMANYSSTINVLGCIAATKTDACMATTGDVLKLYREHFGTVPVELAGRPQPLHVAAAWSDDGKALTIAAVNPTWSFVELSFELSGATLAGTGKAWCYGGVDDEVHNVPGQKPRVRVEERDIGAVGDSLQVGPASVVIYSLDARPLR